MLYPFILTTLAGLSTMFGTLPIFIKIKNKDTLIALACAFASGVMVCVSILDLIPESIKYLGKNYNGFIVIIFSFMAIFLGILVKLIFLSCMLFTYSSLDSIKFFFFSTRL